MLFELLEGVTMGLMLSAAYMYAASLSTKNNIVSLQAIAGTLHHGVGGSTVLTTRMVKLVDMVLRFRNIDQLV